MNELLDIQTTIIEWAEEQEPERVAYLRRELSRWFNQALVNGGEWEPYPEYLAGDPRNLQDEVDE